MGVDSGSALVGGALSLSLVLDPIIRAALAAISRSRASPIPSMAFEVEPSSPLAASVAVYYVIT